MSPERTLHTLVQSIGGRLVYIGEEPGCDLPQWSRGLERVSNHIHRSGKSTVLVLQSDLDKLEGGHHDGFRGSCCETSRDSECLGVLLLTVIREHSSPVAVRTDYTCISNGYQFGHYSHLTALLGASNMRGGTIPRYNLLAPS